MRTADSGFASGAFGIWSWGLRLGSLYGMIRSFYGDKIDDARNILNEIITKDSRIFKDPEPFIAVSELADSSVNIVVRVWSKSTDYWGIYFNMNETVYNEFNKAGLHIPFPQMDVHLHKNHD